MTKDQLLLLAVLVAGVGLVIIGATISRSRPAPGWTAAGCGGVASLISLALLIT
jgi:hypothetical protein